MFRELVLKEIHEYLVSVRLQLGLLLALVLVSVAAFALSAQHSRETHEFSERVQRTEDFLKRYSHLNRVGPVLGVHQPPPSLVLVRGLSGTAAMDTLESNPMPSILPPLDLVSIVAIIFSLLGIVLGFDSINGEKERGTLRLVLANGVRRFDVIAAKWLGGIGVLVATLLAAWLIAAVVTLSQSTAHWGIDEGLSLVSVWGFALLYSGAFFTLALVSSTLAARSSVSVLVSLFAWVLLVFVIPYISPYIAAQVVRVPPLAVLQRDVEYITSEERDDLGRAGTGAVVEKLGCTWISPRRAECLRADGKGKFSFEFQDTYDASEAIKRQIATDAEFRQFYERLRKEVEAVWTEANRKQQAKADRLGAAWRSRADSQFLLSKRLSYASPLPPFVYGCTELALTGFWSGRHFDRQAGSYYQQLTDYLWSRYHEEQAKNPALSVNDFLNISTRPRFQYVPPRFRERLAEALPYSAMLGVWNLAFFAIVLVAFLRFDVR